MKNFYFQSPLFLISQETSFDLKEKSPFSNLKYFHDYCYCFKTYAVSFLTQVCF